MPAITEPLLLKNNELHLLPKKAEEVGMVRLNRYLPAKSLYLVGVIFCSQLRAEYRAFELLISSPTGGDRTIITTLDHLQYSGYHALSPEEGISYVRSWMCEGSTHGFKPICDPPIVTNERPNTRQTDEQSPRNQEP